MTQSQIPTEPFYSVTSISAWAGTTNGILWFGDDIPYVERGGTYYYFGKTKVMHKTESVYTFVYNLICTSEKDLGELK